MRRMPHFTLQQPVLGCVQRFGDRIYTENINCIYGPDWCLVYIWEHRLCPVLGVRVDKVRYNFTTCTHAPLYESISLYEKREESGIATFFYVMNLNALPMFYLPNAAPPPPPVVYARPKELGPFESR